jgi:hypothetical protein
MSDKTSLGAPRPGRKRRPLLSTLARRALLLLSDTYLVLRFTANDAGREYGIARLRKLALILRMIRNSRRIKALSRWQQHVMLAEEILRVPKALTGDVVECGCANGGSTANLSLACALTGRRLVVCDSFEGLPKPKAQEALDVRVDSEYFMVWEEGDYRSEGGLEGVRRTVERFGDASACRFVKGYFCDTLPHLESEAFVLVFEDADLRSSVEDCVRYLWPKLQLGGKFYCHEPFSMQVVSLFFDESWWRTNVGSSPPGFYGSGRGVIWGLRNSNMGFAKKVDTRQIIDSGRSVAYDGSRRFAEQLSARTTHSRRGTPATQEVSTDV